MAIAVLLILLVGIVLFVTEIIPLPVTAMSMCVAFYLTGAVDASTALAAFSSGTAMIIVCMAIVGEAVFKTGGAAKIAHVLTKFADSERKLMFVTVLFSGLMSGFLSNTGAAGLLIALILGISLSTGMKRSKLMYPVIVGCCFGGGITIVGTTSGPYLKEALEGLGTGMTFSFFEWAPLSLILLVASAIYMATIGYKLLPDVPNNEGSYDAASLQTADFSDVPAWKTWLSIGVMVLTLIGMIFEKQIGIKLCISGCVGALALILTGVISEKDALKSIDLKTIFLFGGTLSLASALSQTGAGAMIAETVMGALGENPSPYVLTFVVFILCCVMTNFMSNTATTALMVPICLSIAQGMGADPRAVLMACVIGGSCAYATPIGMPANTMVVGAGGYTFMDYVKSGLPLIVIATIVSMVILPIAFPFFP